MPRPRCQALVEVTPGCRYFKPQGVRLADLQEQRLGFEELEALRLADAEGLYHAEAAARMGISRSSFGRILEGARRKVALALVQGQALALGPCPSR